MAVAIAAATGAVAMVMGMPLAVEVVMLMGMGVVVSVGMGVLVGMAMPVMGMLMGMAMAVLVVVSAAKLVVMNVHLDCSFGFSYIIISFAPYVKTFLWATLKTLLQAGNHLSPMGACENCPDVVSSLQTSFGGILMSEHHDHAYLHAHGIAHSHGHVHENQKAVVNRLARAIGHLEKVKRMVEDGVDCSEVLIQLAAVRSALDNTGKVILKDHMRHCMVDAVAAGDETAIEDLCQAIDKFMK